MSSGTPFLKACGAALAGAVAARGVLDARLAAGTFDALLVAATIVLAWATLPKLGATRAVYIAFGLGFLFGARLA